MVGGDFVQLLGPDVSSNIISFLDDPADIVRATAVSRNWRQFVVENGFCKKLCLRLFPEVSSAAHAIEVDDIIEPVKIGTSDTKALENSEKNHKVYAILARGLSPILRKDCILKAISASSTDNYPEESIQNTLEPRDRIEQKASYWSSEGESDDRVPEKLTYKLISDLCFITEINIQPFQAYFQYEFPIYSAKAVRFRLGHLKSPLAVELMDAVHTDDCFVWTYVSPEFPMVQENCLQKFKLPEPVLCVGAILQIELLGRVQKQEMDDGLYYICVSHVQVVGRTLLPAFDADFVYHPEKCVVKYRPEGEKCASSKRESDDEASPSSQLNTLERLMRRAGGWERVILNTLLGNAVIENENESDEDAVA